MAELKQNRGAADGVLDDFVMADRLADDVFPLGVQCSWSQCYQRRDWKAMETRKDSNLRPLGEGPKVHFVKSKTCNDALDLLSGVINITVKPEL